MVPYASPAPSWWETWVRAGWGAGTLLLPSSAELSIQHSCSLQLHPLRWQRTPREQRWERRTCLPPCLFQCQGSLGATPALLQQVLQGAATWIPGLTAVGNPSFLSPAACLASPFPSISHQPGGSSRTSPSSIPWSEGW